ncbi:MAG: WG repeat-containing protein [Lewinellaceae bacterium]|nr:WG repeat-containing protein [Lewinellaceae bacterium]
MEINRYTAFFLFATMPCLLPAQGNQSNQDFCTFYGNNKFDNTTINTQVVNPEVVNMYNNYTFPLEEMEKITSQIKELKKLEAEIAFQQLSLTEREAIISQKEDSVRIRQEEMDKVRKVNNQTLDNIEKVKKEFKTELHKARLEFEAALSSLPGNAQDNGPLNIKIRELKTVGESIIGSAENCMSEDFTIYPIRDSTSHKTIYGFSLKEIRNDPNYVFIDKFTNGLARVKRNNKFGFYNNEGKLAIPFKYDFAESFRENYTLVKNYGKWFLIDRNEKELFNFNSLVDKYEFINEVREITYFSKNLFVLYAKLDKKDRNRYNRVEYFVINDQGKIISGPFYYAPKDVRFETYEVTDNSGVEVSNTYGLIDRNGRYIIELGKYSNIGEFNPEGVSIVEIKDVPKKSILEKINLKKDQDEQYPQDPLIDYYAPKHDDGGSATKRQQARIKKQEKSKKSESPEIQKFYGLVDKSGRALLQCQYKEIKKLDTLGLFLVADRNNKKGLANAHGKIILDAEYSWIGEFNALGLARCGNESGKYGVVNVSGYQVVPNEYFSIDKFDQFGLAKFKKNNNGNYYGVLNDKGEVVVPDVKYKEIDPFNQYGFAIAQYDVPGKKKSFLQNYPDIKKNCVINTKGDVIFEDERHIYFFSSSWDLFLISNTRINYSEYNEDKYESSEGIGIVNSSGKIVQEPKYSQVYLFDKNGYAKVKVDQSRYGLIDKTGNQVLDCKYERIIDSFDETKTAIVSKGYYGAVDLNGLEFIPCIFNSVSRVDGGFSVENSDTTFKVNHEGKCISQNKEQYDAFLKKHYQKN